MNNSINSNIILKPINLDAKESVSLSLSTLFQLQTLVAEKIDVLSFIASNKNANGAVVASVYRRIEVMQKTELELNAAIASFKSNNT
jgi:hypothetical protein